MFERVCALFWLRPRRVCVASWRVITKPRQGTLLLFSPYLVVPRPPVCFSLWISFLISLSWFIKMFSGSVKERIDSWKKCMQANINWVAGLFSASTWKHVGPVLAFTTARIHLLHDALYKSATYGILLQKRSCWGTSDGWTVLLQNSYFSTSS